MPTVDDTDEVMIRSIIIENFRGIRKLDLQFETPKGEPSPIVVLAGPNGCGKTAVLEACLMAAGHPSKVRGSRGKAAIRKGAESFSIVTEFSINGNPVNSGLSTGKTATLHWPCLYFSSGRSQTLVGAMGLTAGSGRTKEANGKRKTQQKPAERDRLSRIKQYLIDAWARGMFDSLGEKSELSTGLLYKKYFHTISEINRIWALFYPNDSRRFKVAPIESDDVEAGFDVFLQGNAEIPLSVDDLSSGQLELFCYAGTPTIEKFQRGLVIVDELELHLDPQWHRLMLQAMRIIFPGCQLIVTTHSPAIYESVLSFERHFLIPESDPRARIWSQPLVPGE